MWRPCASDNAIQENVSTVRILNAKEEIVNGDRLVPAPRGTLMSYSPHPPTRPIQAEIIATDRDSIEAGRGWIVTLDKGASRRCRRRNGARRLSRGAAHSRSAGRRAPDRPAEFVSCRIAIIKVPDERIGLVFVFRVFDRLSYALVLNTTDPVVVGNYTRNP